MAWLVVEAERLMEAGPSVAAPWLPRGGRRTVAVACQFAHTGLLVLELWAYKRLIDPWLAEVC